MTSKEIYEAIDQSKIGDKGKNFLKNAEEKTKGFTIENEQLNNAMNKIYNDLKEKKPEALKNLKVEEVKVEVKTTSTKKTKKPTTKIIKNVTKKKNTKPTKTPSTPKEDKVPFTKRASEYAKKNGITYKEAMKKLSEKMKDEEDKATKKATKELESLLKFVRSDKFEDGKEYPKTYGKQDPKTASLSSDAKRLAKPVGKRVSKNGKTYYEYRDNRSDRNSIPAPKGEYRYKGKTPPYLEMGGELEDNYVVIGVWDDGTKDIIINGVSKEEADKTVKRFASSRYNSVYSEKNSFAKGGNLEVHGLKVGDRIIETIEGGIQMVKDKNGNIMFVNLENGERSVDVPLPFAKGGMTEHGLKVGDTIRDDMFWEKAIVVKDKKGNLAKVNIDKGERIESMGKGGSFYEQGGEIDAFIMRTIKGVPNSNLEVDAQELKAKLEKGGRIVKIVNEGEEFDEEKYQAIFGDYDGDGVANINDISPLDKSKRGRVEQIELDQTFRKLIDLKNNLDDKMYKALDKLDKKAPKNAEFYARTKTPFSIVKKLVDKRLLDPKKGLTDMIGTTVVVENQAELEKVKNDINKGLMGDVLDFDDFYKNPNNGYRAYHFIVEFEGMPIEIQLKTKMQKQLNEVSHEFYKKGNLDAKGLDEVSKMIMQADKGDKQALAKVKKLLANKTELASKISNKMAMGGTLPTNFGQAGLVGETGAMNEIDLFAMGGDLPQGVHQYFQQTYNPAFPTPHGYAKGGVVDLFEDYEKMPDKLSKVAEKYQEKYEDGDMDYEDTKRFQKEVEALGYTFDFGLDNEPFGLRKKGVALSSLKGYEEMDSDYFAKGGETEEKGKRLKSALMRDRKYFNKDESWERGYSKGKNRKGYKGYEEGGQIEMNL